jgi:secretion/DNA translocation related CpaE-like protein
MRDAPSDVLPRRPLLVTSDAELLDDLLRLCGAAGVEADVAHDEAVARHTWAEAPVVVVGSDLASRLARTRVPRRAGVVLVGLDFDDAGVWDLAVEVGADSVVFLPDSQAWLIDRLGEAGDGPTTGGVTVAVLGGRGGAGASILSAALACIAADTGVTTMLIDADPVGGGIDMLLGREDASGLRWPDLTSAAGRLSAESLRAALPRVGLLSVLSCGRGESLQLPVDAVRSVLAAARRSHDLVVVDLPRHLDEVAELVLSTATLTLIVVPAEVRATAAAGRVAVGVGLVASDVRAIVRGPAPSGLTGPLVADALGLPLAGWLDAEPGLPRALEHGRRPGADGKGPLACLCRALLDDLLAESRRAA